MCPTNYRGFYMTFKTIEQMTQRFGIGFTHRFLEGLTFDWKHEKSNIAVEEK